MLNRLIISTLISGLFLIVGITNANAVVIDFEEDTWIDAQQVGTYEGVTFGSEWLIWDDYTSASYPQGSGTDAIYSHNYGGTIDFNTEVTINSVWLASADYQQSMYFEGYDSLSTLIFTSSVYAGGYDGTVSLNWGGVQTLSFVSTEYNFFILDDIDYQSGAPVPEPTTLALLGIGLVGLVGGAARKKLKKKEVSKK